MPTTTIPLELIEAIVHEVDDAATLKACSMASSSFCGLSQCRLLRSLKLTAPRARSTNGYSKLAALFLESPHVPRYVTKLELTVGISLQDPHKIKPLQEVLANLTNVRRCTIAGESTGLEWDALALAVPAVMHLI
ncbi:hypothetical protein B0H19DRAFT_1271303 [Mycena capillaripes]|nr:hypothetical protein B0H19DRAFT_1271303 [Mycena capillaripes]